MPNNVSPFNRGIGRLFSSTSGFALEFFIENNTIDYSINEVHKLSKISVKSLQTILPRFVNEGILDIPRKVGHNQMYKLCDNSKVHGLTEFHIQMTKDVV